MPAFIIVKSKTPRLLPSYDIHEGPESTEWRYQKKAWMDDVLGVDWFINVFLKYCGSQRPQLLILDSHNSHETPGLLEEALHNDIELIVLSPHTTHLCPLDRCVKMLLILIHKHVIWSQYEFQ
jgi:hypothetical protein